MQSLSNVSLTSFGIAGQGGDDTQVFQTALNATAVRGQTLEIPAGSYRIRPIFFPANSTVVADPNVTVQAMPGYGETDHMLNIADVQNVSLTGTPGRSIFRMQKAEYTSGEYRHCLSITGATNVRIDGIQCNNSGGDGVYIGDGSQQYSANVQIKNSGFDNNRRQGMTVISARNLVVSNCNFTNTSGTPPSDGIDIEPNLASDSLVNVEIDSSSVTGNAGNGLTFGIERLNAGSAPVSIRVSNLSSQGNGGSGFFAANGQDGPGLSVPGNVTVSNSSSTNDTQYGAVASYWDAGGTSLVFQNLTVANANRWHNNVDNAAIAVKRGGGAVNPMGNVHFLGTSISDSTGNLDTYFTVWDWSHVGITQVQFMDSRTLSGARQNTSLLSGLPTAVINLP
jgi:Right handed beta helix region